MWVVFFLRGATNRRGTAKILSAMIQKTQRLLHPGRQVLFLLMIVLLVSTLKLSELTQLFSTSFISFRRFGANIMHFFLNRGSFCIRKFFRNHNQWQKTKNQIESMQISQNSAHLRYDHLFPWNAFVLPACRFGTGWIKPTVLVGTWQQPGSWFGPGGDASLPACPLPALHHHIMPTTCVDLEKRVLKWWLYYCIFGWFLVRGVFDWFLRCGSSRQSVWPPGWLVLSLVAEIHKVMIFC